MDYINRIEIQGRVGTVRTNVAGENMVANFSLVTEHMYKSRDGNAVNETTWHHVVAWEGRDMPDLKTIEKGLLLNVKGRVRFTKYTASDGTEKQIYEILASSIKAIGNQ